MSNKGIFIDSTNRKISEITIKSWKDISPAIGCDLFTTVSIDRKNDVYVDDEGLVKNPTTFFMIKGYPSPLAGNGIILGTNRQTGESEDTTLTVENVKKMVKFMDINTVGMLSRMKVFG